MTASATNVALLIAGFALGMIVFYVLLLLAWAGIMYLPLHRKRWREWSSNWSRGVWVGSGLLLHRVLEKHAHGLGVMDPPPTTQSEWAEYIRSRRPIRLAHVSGGVRRSRHHPIDRTVIEMVLHPPELDPEGASSVAAGGIPVVLGPHGRPVAQGRITGKACDGDERCGIEGEWTFRFHVEDGMSTGSPVLFLRWRQSCLHYGACRFAIAHWQPAKRLFFGSWHVFRCYCPVPLFDNGPLLLAPLVHGAPPDSDGGWIQVQGQSKLGECADTGTAPVGEGGLDLETGAEGGVEVESEAKGSAPASPVGTPASTLGVELVVGRGDPESRGAGRPTASGGEVAATAPPASPSLASLGSGSSWGGEVHRVVSLA